MPRACVSGGAAFGAARGTRCPGVVQHELVGAPMDESFVLMPPFYATGGTNTRIGRNVFINQNCTFYDLGGIEIADDVLIGPNVSIITSSHPIEPAQRRNGVIASPIVIEKNVWIAAGATIIGGVTVGENSVVAAGSVVTPETLQQAGLLRKGADDVKVLGNGELSVALTVRAHRFTRSAADKIQGAGGTVERLGGAVRKFVRKKKTGTATRNQRT